MGKTNSSVAPLPGNAFSFLPAFAFSQCKLSYGEGERKFYSVANQKLETSAVMAENPGPFAAG